MYWLFIDYRGKVMFSQVFVRQSKRCSAIHSLGTRHIPSERVWNQTESDIIPPERT